MQNPMSPAAGRREFGRRLRPPVWSSRTLRRRGVLAAYGGLAGWAAWSWLNLGYDPATWIKSGIFLAMAVHSVGLAVLASARVGAWKLANDSDARLDERQRAVRDRAFRCGYALLGGAVVLAASYLALALDFGWPLPRSAGAIQLVIWTVVVATTTIPTAVLAWTEPDPDPDDPQAATILNDGTAWPRRP